MKVLKTITTPTQRIPAGTELADDVALDGPLTRADWQRAGHLEGLSRTAPVKPPRLPPAVAELTAAED